MTVLSYDPFNFAFQELLDYSRLAYSDPHCDVIMPFSILYPLHNGLRGLPGTTLYIALSLCLATRFSWVKHTSVSALPPELALWMVSPSFQPLSRIQFRFCKFFSFCSTSFSPPSSLAAVCSSQCLAANTRGGIFTCKNPSILSIPEKKEEKATLFLFNNRFNYVENATYL